ncbi:MAG TPA: hypothetical protein VGR27_07670 [Longimicrobiaceae bacterium]|nr:hypothetical protein [Longimicrobiaceae bacterium]
MRRYLLMPVLALLLLASACGGTRTEPAPRTLESMLPQLTRSLTPQGARDAFGAPDEEPGSGLIIYVYRVDQGRSVWLGFPGFEPIIYAKLRDPSGRDRELPLPE